MKRPILSTVLFMAAAGLLLFVVGERTRHSSPPGAGSAVGAAAADGIGWRAECANQELIIGRLRADAQRGFGSYGQLPGVFELVGDDAAEAGGGGAGDAPWYLYRYSTCANTGRAEPVVVTAGASDTEKTADTGAAAGELPAGLRYRPYLLNHGVQLLPLRVAFALRSDRQAGAGAQESAGAEAGAADGGDAAEIVRASARYLVWQGSAHRLLFALFCALLLGWIFIELGRLGGIAGLVALLAAVPVLLAAGNTLVPLYTAVLPFGATAWMLFLLRRKEIGKRGLLWLGYFMILLYSLLLGSYIYSVPAFLAAILPLGYYALIDRWSWSRFSHYALRVGGCMLGAFAAGGIILVTQSFLAIFDLSVLWRSVVAAFSGPPYAGQFIVRRVMLDRPFLSFGALLSHSGAGGDVLGGMSIRPFLTTATAAALIIITLNGLAGHSIYISRRLHPILNYKLLVFSLTALYSIIPPLALIVIAKSFILRALGAGGGALALWVLPTLPIVAAYFVYLLQRLWQMLFSRKA